MEVHSLNFSKILKKYLFSLIDDMGKNHALYTRNPNRDFSRIKKWSFSKTLLCTLSIGADFPVTLALKMINNEREI